MKFGGTHFKEDNPICRMYHPVVYTRFVTKYLSRSLSIETVSHIVYHIVLSFTIPHFIPTTANIDIFSIWDLKFRMRIKSFRP